MTTIAKKTRWFNATEVSRYAVYIPLSLTITWPLIQRGYILVLDMVFTPHIRMPTNVNSSYLFYTLLHVLNFVLPSDVIEKIMLFVILLLAGVGMHLLAMSFSTKKPEMNQKLGWYFSGSLYMINPFTYDRFMTGQYGVLLGYAFLPWFIRALLNFLTRPTRRQTILLTVWALITSIVSIHAIGFMAIVSVIALGLKTWHQRKDKIWRNKILKFGSLAIILFIAASGYWLVPLALGHGNTATTIDSFNTTDQTAFATLGGSTIGRLDNVLHLQGFWAEGQGLYKLPQDHIPVWSLLALMLWILVLVGCIDYWRSRQRFVVALFGLSLLLAIVLSIGTLNSWLASHVPLFAGYREPEKFVTLVALAFAVFASRGVSTALKYCYLQGGEFFLVFTSVLLLLIPIVWTPTMLWGFNNQLMPALYPPDWYMVNKRLDSDPSKFQVLFLPWHQYMYFDFAGRIIASPAPQFFDKPTVVSNNPEFKNIPPLPNTRDTSISYILSHASEQNDLGSRLAPFDIKYVLLARDDDYATYGYLDHQSSLKLVSKSATLELYRNEAFKEQ